MIGLGALFEGFAVGGCDCDRRDFEKKKELVSVMKPAIWDICCSIVKCLCGTLTSVLVSVVAENAEQIEKEVDEVEVQSK